MSVDSKGQKYPYCGSDDDDSDSSDGSWIKWFCSLDGHEFFVEVDEEYIRDNFNLYGLKCRIEKYDRAMEMILGDVPDEDDLLESAFLQSYRDATDLYGLIHARYILSPKGLLQMKEKYINSIFGQCPRVLCDRQNVLPVGMSEELHTHRVRSYCPRCQEVYDFSNNEDHWDIDGAYFGSSFPHTFFLTYCHFLPLEPPIPYVPKVFGFRVHQRKSIIKIKLDIGEYGASLANMQIKKSENKKQIENFTNNGGGKGGDGGGKGGGEGGEEAGKNNENVCSSVQQNTTKTGSHGNTNKTNNSTFHMCNSLNKLNSNDKTLSSPINNSTTEKINNLNKGNEILTGVKGGNVANGRVILESSNFSSTKKSLFTSSSSTSSPLYSLASSLSSAATVSYQPLMNTNIEKYKNVVQGSAVSAVNVWK